MKQKYFKLQSAIEVEYTAEKKYYDIDIIKYNKIKGNNFVEIVANLNRRRLIDYGVPFKVNFVLYLKENKYGFISENRNPIDGDIKVRAIISNKDERKVKNKHLIFTFNYMMANWGTDRDQISKYFNILNRKLRISNFLKNL